MMTNNSLKKSKIIGLGILEVMLVLGVIAMIAILSMRYYNVVRTQQAVNQVLIDIKEINEGMREWAIENPTLTGLSISALISGEFISRRLNGPQSSLNNAVYILNNSGGYNALLFVNNLPPQVCEGVIGKLGIKVGDPSTKVRCLGRSLRYDIDLTSL